MLSLSERMKNYEVMEISQFSNDEFVIARVDGRSFSKFTKKLEKPYDIKFSKIMEDTTKYVMDKISCHYAYHQSDEATFIFKPCDISRFFDSKKPKLTSIIASMFSSKFLIELSKQYPEIFDYASEYVPHFDCRVFSVPLEVEAINCLLWRIQDAKRNSVSMLAQAHFPHKSLQNKNSKDMKRMLLDIGIDYDTYPANFRVGTLFKKQLIEKNIDDKLCFRSEIVSNSFDTYHDIKDFFNE